MMNKKQLFLLLIIAIIVSSASGAVAGFFYAGQKQSLLPTPKVAQADTIVPVDYQAQSNQVVKVVEETSPAVVSIIVTKDLPKVEQYFNDGGMEEFLRQFFDNGMPDMNLPQYRENGTQKQEVGGGTGFIISADGYIVTNKHVVYDDEAEYTVLVNDEQKYPAKVLAKDTVNDIAILKIDAKDLRFLSLADSDQIKVGQSVIAIGNALGEFSNTVSTGVISGLSRSITAGSYRTGSERMMGLIQTDASINPGNSGGPLLNLDGHVVGVNVAMAQGAQNIGFTIPINQVKSAIDSVKQNGRIVRPWLGVRYMMVNEAIAKENKLPEDYGALILRGEQRTDLAVIPGSPADKAGLVENDIVLEVNGEAVKGDNDLTTLINKHKVGTEVELTISHQGKHQKLKIKLEENK